MYGVIHPVAEDETASVGTVCYQIVAWKDNLPAFDPLPVVKTKLLSRSSLQAYNRVVTVLVPLLIPIVYTGLAIRFVAFAAPANVGRILAPISVSLHLCGMITTTAQLRTEYVKLILRTFDFWFLEAANTVWAIVLAAVMNDVRVVLVLFCWADFTGWLLQETYLRNSYSVVVIAFVEWLFYVLLMVGIVLDLVDEVRHFTLITTGNRMLSTKDVLLNVTGTMTMLSLRNLYRRYQHVRHQTKKTGMNAMKALGYRCKIALSPSGPQFISIQTNRLIVDKQQNLNLATGPRRTFKPGHPPLLQMHLCAESDRFDPRYTVWPRIGGLNPLDTWKLVVLYTCGALGGTFILLSLFLSKNIVGIDIVAAVGLVLSAVFSGVYACCTQRQLLKRIVTSFHFVFLSTQILAIGLSFADMFNWRWVPVCGVASCLILSYSILTVDALTPIMKRRLRFTYWIFISGIALFAVVQIVLALDVLVLGRWELQDRVFVDFTLLGRQVKLHIVPFLFSRVFTVFVWSGRYVYVALSRVDENALLLLRGDVEFDYESWKKLANLSRLGTQIHT